MKTIFALCVLIAAAGSVKAQNSSYHFTSEKQQQVKYDSTNKIYFIDSEVSNVSEIRIDNNMISFVSNNKKSSVFINNMSPDSFNGKTSFTLSGYDTDNGKKVKLSFWFIDGVLDEVSYVNEAVPHSIAFKDLSAISSTPSNAIASVHTPHP